MKGFVLTLRNDFFTGKLSDVVRPLRGIGSFLRRRGLQTVLALLFLFGIVLGAACAQSFSRTTYDKLDLLFVTNIGARAQMTLLQIALSCFVSYFLFVFCAFLCALSAWGAAVVPLICASYGFTVGLSSAFIFSLYHMQGIGFYLLIVLPGTLLFALTLLRYCVYCFRLSRCYTILSLFGADREPELNARLKLFLRKSLLILLSVLTCSIVDMMLWMLFADKFQFI